MNLVYQKILEYQSHYIYSLDIQEWAYGYYDFREEYSYFHQVEIVYFSNFLYLEKYLHTFLLSTHLKNNAIDNWYNQVDEFLKKNNFQSSQEFPIIDIFEYIYTNNRTGAFRIEVNQVQLNPKISLNE